MCPRDSITVVPRVPSSAKGSAMMHFKALPCCPREGDTYASRQMVKPGAGLILGERNQISSSIREAALGDFAIMAAGRKFGGGRFGVIHLTVHRRSVRTRCGKRPACSSRQICMRLNPVQARTSRIVMSFG